MQFDAERGTNVQAERHTRSTVGSRKVPIVVFLERGEVGSMVLANNTSVSTGEAADFEVALREALAHLLAAFASDRLVALFGVDYDMLSHNPKQVGGDAGASSFSISRGTEDDPSAEYYRRARHSGFDQLEVTLDGTKHVFDLVRTNDWPKPRKTPARQISNVALLSH